MTHRRQNQRGFALLLVFAMAAAAVIMLYLEMPRVAFEHQRDKEGLLVERGEQYVRGIQLYVNKFGKYPQTLDELETSNNQRFLRRRYKDPMTGSDEWRLIHYDGMQFTDSLVHKRQDQKEQSGPSILASNIQGIGSQAQFIQQAGEKNSAATRRTASDRIIPGTPGATGSSGAQGDSANPQDSSADESRSGPPPPETSAPANRGTLTTMPGGVNSQGANQNPNNPFQPVNQQTAGYPGQPVNSQQGGMTGVPMPGSSNQSQQGSGSGFGFSGSFGSSSGSSSGSSASPGSGMVAGGLSGGGMSGGYGQQGQMRPGQPNQAIQAIQSMLTSPRQGGAPSTVGNTMGGGAAIGGGIAGVASKAEMEGIRVYNERTNYKEWEFLWDQKKAQQQASQAGAGQGTQTGQGQGQNNANRNPFGGSMSGSGSSNSGFTLGGGSGSSSSSSSSGFGFGGGFGSGGFGSNSGSSPKPAPSTPVKP